MCNFYKVTKSRAACSQSSLVVYQGNLRGSIEMEKKANRNQWGRRWLFVLVISPAIGLGHEARAVAQPFSVCSEEFWQQRPPEVTPTGPLLALCARHFAALYSSHSATPVYSAEHSTAQHVADAIHMPQHNDFHEDNRLPFSDAASLEEYRGSGYDRGHMAPSGDEPDGLSQYQSFALSNMIPQNANDNRYLWAEIETAVRELVLSGGDEVLVVTGPLFKQNAAGALHGQVEIPAFIYKAVYDPAAGIAGVYVAPNVAGWQFWRLSLTDFRNRSGIDPFPGLPTNVEVDSSKLPDPIHNRYAHR
jgi:endonuclease G